MSFSLHQYGISLRRITSNDLELIRKHRNLLKIRSTMRYQKRISRSQQKKWFSQINNANNYYFLIEVNDKYIGLINCKDVNVIDEIGEGGIFIWDEQYLNSPYSLTASVLLIDFIFNIIEIGQTSIINVLPNNEKAIKYNQFLGYNISEVNPDKSIRLELTKERFNQKLPSLKKSCMSYMENYDGFAISGFPSEINLPKINDFLVAHQNTPD